MAEQIKAKILGAYRPCVIERVTRGKSGTLYAYVRCIGGIRVQGYPDNWRVSINNIRKADRPLIEQLGAEFDRHLAEKRERKKQQQATLDAIDGAWQASDEERDRVHALFLQKLKEKHPGHPWTQTENEEQSS